MSLYRGTRHLSNARLGNRILTSVERLAVFRCVAPLKSCPEDVGRCSICTTLKGTGRRTRCALRYTPSPTMARARSGFTRFHHPGHENTEPVGEEKFIQPWAKTKYV